MKCRGIEQLRSEISGGDIPRLKSIAEKVYEHADKTLQDNRDEDAKTLCSEALKITDGVEDLAGVRAGFARLLANYHFKHGHLKESLERNIEAAELMLAGANYQGAAVVYGNCGALLHNLGDKATAYEYHLKVLDLAEQHDLQQQKARALVNIAIILKSRKEYHSALVMLERALDVFATLVDKPGVAYSLDGIAQVYSRLGKPEESLLCHQEALRIRRVLGNQYEILLSLINTSAAMLENRQPKQALAVCGEALILAETGLKPNLRALVLQNLARSHLDMGNPDEAMGVIAECEELYSEIPGYQSTKSELKQLKAQTLHAQGKCREAYDALSEHIEMEKDIYAENLEDSVSRIRIASEVKTCIREREIQAEAFRKVVASEKRLDAALKRVRELEGAASRPSDRMDA